MHEDVEEEVVLAIGHVADGIRTDHAVGVCDTKCHATTRRCGVNDAETVVVRNHAGWVRGAGLNCPYSPLTIHHEVGSGGAIANHLAACIGKGIAICCDAYRPIIVVLIGENSRWNDFVATIHRAVELGSGKFAADQSVADGEIGVCGLIVTGSEDDAIAFCELTDTTNTDVITARNRLCSDIAIASHINVVDF